MVNSKPTLFNICYLHLLAEIFLLFAAFYPILVTAQLNAYPTSFEHLIDDTSSLPGTELYLEVIINQTHFGIARFGYQDDTLWVSAETLKQLHFNLPTQHKSLIGLHELTEISYRYHADQQRLIIDAPLSLLTLNATTIDLIASEQVQAHASKGALLNYDLHLAKNITNSLSSFSELRLFNPFGLLSTTQQSHNTLGHPELSSSLTRIDTAWRSSFEDKHLFLNLGDTVTRALTWSRATRIAGLQIATDFSLQPYMPTAPLTTFYGSATVPSNVELYIDGIKRYSGEVPIGHFALNSLPTVSGEGKAQIVLTDSLGRATTQNISFYNDQTLLREGLVDWSAEIGFIRENYAIRSFDYASKPVISTTVRYGENNYLTTGTHAELATDLFNLGIESHWIPQIGGGTLSTAIAISTDSRTPGWLYYAGYHWANNLINFSASATITTPQYYDIATNYSAPPLAFNGNAVFGYNSEYLGSFNLSYFGFRPHNDPTIGYLGAHWYKPINDTLSISASINKKLTDDKESIIYLAATMILGNKQSIRITSQKNQNAQTYQINANQSAPSEGGLGWNITASKQDSENNHQIDINYFTDKIHLSSGFNNLNQTHSQYIGASGAIVAANNHFFISKPIMNSFAIVSTNGIGNLPIRLENSVIGTTNHDGLLLIPSLNSYQRNVLTLDPTHLPANIQVKQTQIDVIPKYHSGVLAKFDLIKTHPALVILADPNGVLLPEGSQVALNGQKENLVTVGYDGIAYFDTLKTDNHLLIHYPKGECTVTFTYPKTDELIPQIGPLHCHPESSPYLD
ncbi:MULTISPECIES: fimbria/pilus outer membrane usher protein [Providencia]|uniref:fimbria/pilus outer membrane usher protein n=1 Tax=Providencia TaxID=586 RepID=UPI000EF8A2E5|nr:MULTISPECIES: fimbria/pilus outer membrane usher protein [Providencia]EMF0916760.1 fimbrial biogenesis outer membrane usher protein [Providencia stuartii]RMA07771.1 fimbrial biogenesis outer membrane usher protein [Providencia stuartii]